MKRCVMCHCPLNKRKSIAVIGPMGRQARLCVVCVQEGNTGDCIPGTVRQDYRALPMTGRLDSRPQTWNKGRRHAQE